MTRRALVAFALVACAAACEDDTVRMCGGGGSGASCEQACERLFAIECEVGESMEECVATCNVAIAPLEIDVRDRVLACYGASSSCEQIDGCSLACGTDGNAVVFGMPQDGGLPDAGVDDAGEDAGDLDAGEMGEDAGEMSEDAGEMGEDAGSLDGG